MLELHVEKHEMSDVVHAVSWERWLQSRRTRSIFASLGLLSLILGVAGGVFFVETQVWMKWALGLLLAFNILVAARVAISSPFSHRDGH